MSNENVGKSDVEEILRGGEYEMHARTHAHTHARTHMHTHTHRTAEGEKE